MKKRREVSISEARAQLPSLVRDAERGSTVTLTRRGEAVAVLISTSRYGSYVKTAIPLARALEGFRASVDLDELDIDGVYEDVRDPSLGRVVRL